MALAGPRRQERPPASSRIALLGLAWLVLTGQPHLAAAQETLLAPALQSAKAKPSADPAATTPDDERGTVDNALATAREALAHPPNSITAASRDERLEQQYLATQLVRSLERQRETLQKLRQVQQQTAEEIAQAKTWKGPDSPPPYSALRADQVRDARDNALAQAKAADVRQTLLSDEQAAATEKFKAATVQLHQIEEKLPPRALAPNGTGAITPAEAPLRWQRDLLELRSRLAAQTAAEADAGMRLASAEAALARAQADVYTLQLEAMRPHLRFSQADLDTVLAALDKELAQQETELARQRQRNEEAQRALDEAEKSLLRARLHPGRVRSATLEALARSADLRRLQLDNAHLAYDTQQSLIDLRNHERKAWQYRWMLMNTHDAAKLRETSGNFSNVQDRLESWTRYLNGEIDLANEQASDYQHRQGSTTVAVEKASLREFQQAYEARADIYRHALQVVNNLHHTLGQWQEEFDASRGDLALGERMRGWITLLAGYARALWNFELFTAEDSLDVDGRQIKATRSITVGKSIGAVLLLVLGYVLSAWLVRLLHGLAVTRFGIQPALARIFSRWGHFILVAVLFVVALDLVKIPLTVFAFLGGALAIGFGFGAQNLLKNLMSGIMLLIERPLRVGDRVEVGNVVGTVTNISIRSSIVRSSNGIETLIPNSSFLENNVVNWTYSNARVRQAITVGTDYGTAPPHVAATLLDVAQRHGEVLPEPAPRVLLEDFGADALMFCLEYWIDYAQGADGRQIASDLRFMIEAAFTDAGIGIPYPQRVVHLHAAEGTTVQPA